MDSCLHHNILHQAVALDGRTVYLKVQVDIRTRRGGLRVYVTDARFTFTLSQILKKCTEMKQLAWLCLEIMLTN